MADRERFAPVRVNPLLRHPAERRLALDGRWGFRLDPGDRGLAERWFAGDAPFVDPIDVPGCWQGQGYGGDGEELVWDFRIRARTFRATYTGTGWYARTFRVPDDWREGRLVLAFGGAHPSAEVWVNGVAAGTNDEPFVPFGFDVTDLIRAGENLVVVRIHEAARELGLAFSWQGNWSGLYRGVDLVATGPACVDRLALLPDVASGRIAVRGRIAGDGDGPFVLRVSAANPSGGIAAADEFPVAPGEFSVALPVLGPRLWSPDVPELYAVDVALVSGDAILDAARERTGFVEYATDGKQVRINDEPYYLRGTGEFQPWPETGSPDTDRARLRKKLAALRDYGYNYVRCQSYVPSPEYYDAADEVGLIVQSEMGTLGAWGSNTEQHAYAWPAPSPAVREALRRQWNAVVRRDASHPSATIYCMSNELGGGTLYPRIAWRCYAETKAEKPNALVLWTDGGWNANLPGDFVNDEASKDAQVPKPLVQHEFRWWSSYPDVRSMAKYSGAIRPYAQEIALAAAARHGIAHTLARAADTSQRLQLVEAKGKMEACRRDNPTLAGICHFNAMDAIPSPQGIIDEFHDRKIADAATWRETNGDTTVLASLGFDDRVLVPGQRFACDLFLSDWSHPPLASPHVEWRIVSGDRVLASGRTDFAHAPYRTCPAGRVEATIPVDARAPATARIEAAAVDGDRRFGNAWDLWLFPEESPLPSGVALYGLPRATWLAGVVGPPPFSLASPRGNRAVLSETLDDALVRFMRKGGRVVLAAGEGLVRPFNPKFGHRLGHYYFTPPANYPPYEDGHDGTIVADHPMLGAFPHDGWADLEFFRVMADSPPLELESLFLNDADPTVRVMHSYPVARSLGYLVERRVGRGGLVISALDLGLPVPEARYLLAAISAYATGSGFAPSVEMSVDAIAAIMSGTALATVELPRANP